MKMVNGDGYPPDLQDVAVQNDLQQAQAPSAEWTTCEEVT